MIGYNGISTSKKCVTTILVIMLIVCIIVSVGYLWNKNVASNAELKSSKKLLFSTQNELTETQELLQDAIIKNNNLSQELEIAQTTISDLKNTEYEVIYYNDFKITHYCNELYNHICGGNSVTASGTTVEVGRTVAVDPSIIPYGTNLYIEGYGFRIAEDCGGAVNGHQIDVVVQTHDEAMALGNKHNVGVWILLPQNN